MPDRSDPPEYDWLYGKDAASRESGQKPTQKPSRQQPADDPEPTRVMPRTPRPTGSAQQPSRPPGRLAPSPAPEKQGRRVPYGKLILLLLVAWIAYLVAVPIFAWNRIDTVNAIPGGDRPADQD